MRPIELKWYLLLLIIGLTCIPLVSAVTVDVSPHQVQPGDFITVTTTGLKDGSNVTMKLIAIVDEPGSAYKMDIGNLNFPINLDQASFKITNQNTGTNTVNIINYIPSIGTTFITIGGVSENNTWSREISGQGRDDINGTFSLIRVAGNKNLGSDPPVISTMEWNGIKEASKDEIPDQVDGGPEDFTLSFSQTGINAGTIEVIIIVDDVMVTSDKVIIGNPVISPHKISTQTTSSTLAGIVKNNQPYLIPSFIQQGITPGYLPDQSQMKGHNAIPSFVSDSGAGNRGVFSQFLVSTPAINNGKYVKII